MTKPAHTPGPWKVQPSFSIKAQEVGTVVYGNPDNPNRGHDAALIAAAPDLLVALKTAIRHARDAMPLGERAEWDAGRSGPEWMFIARAALAKAEGRS